MISHRRIPVGAADLIIRVSASGRKELPPFGDILFPLLPSYFDLLLLPTTSEVILFESTLAFIGCGTRSASRQRNQGEKC
jgi:hypothetical protein